MPSTCVKCQAELPHNEDALELSILKRIVHYYCSGYFKHNYKKM